MRKPNGFRRLGLGLGGGIEVRHTRLVIRLPDPRLLRLVARTLLLAAAILSLFWLREGSDIVSDDAARQRTAVGADDVFLYTLLRDMRHRDLLSPKDRAVFFNEADASDRSMSMQEASADFVFSAFAGDFDRIDRILKPGGVLAVQLSSNPSESFQPPANYRTAYFGRIGSATMVAMRKSLASKGGMRLRRLLAVPEARKEALSGLEGVLLEPPYRQGWRWAAKYLPELTGDKLDGYPRRVFVEVAAAGEASSGAAWFERHYPRKGRTFEVIRVEVEEESDEAEEKGEEASPSLAEWLERNVREEEYVVVKAEAAAVEEAVAEGAIGLVDELFLECDHQLWEEDEKKKQKARKGGRRAYWECLVLYGKLRDAGVAVHQWWNF
ncbi:hypothetical protein Cni_G12519 [Canna indica]|uniref:DUF7870 domain-containing protein n=1 Tax=Canna indica TaxID=4628 RepID=A0AAQ3K9I3_9LILI|nr:hypothetical protein Cni_G12519 [Canna indica]